MGGDEAAARIEMKPEIPASADAKLDQTLREWRVETSLPPRFQEQVWQRISRAPAAPELHLGTSLLRLLEFALPRPKVAFSYLAALLLVGTLAGSWAAQVRSQRVTSSLGQRYVQSVTPFQSAALDR